MTSLAECWMHISTFDEGKKINRSQHDSWEGQCTGAGLSLNEGLVWGPTCWGKVVSVPANTVYKSYTTTFTRVVEQDHKWKSSQQAKQQRKKSQQTSVDNSLSSKGSYSWYDGGPNVLMFHKVFLQIIFKII